MDFHETLRSIAFPLVRMAGFCANALLFGIPMVVLLVVRPAFRAAGAEGWRDARQRVAGRLEGFVQAAFVASATATVVALALQALVVSDLTEGDVTLSSLTSVLETGFGRWHLVRLVLILVLGLLLHARVRDWSLAEAGDPSGTPGRLWWASWLVLGAAVLATTSLSGHAAVASPRAGALVNDVVHLAAGAVWFSGIIVLAVALPDGWAGRSSLDRLTLLSPAIDRFAGVALVSIGIVALTGILNSLLNVGAVNDLVDTGYGRSLTLKLALFVAILSLGGFNHFAMRRRLKRALDNAEATTTPSLLRRTIAAELVVAISIMGLTGILVGEAKTRQPAPTSGAGVSARD